MADWLNFSELPKGFKYDAGKRTLPELISFMEEQGIGNYGIEFSMDSNPGLRALLSGQPEKNILATLRKKYGWAEPIKYLGKKTSAEKKAALAGTSVPAAGSARVQTNYMYKDEEGKYRLFNPAGFDLGDITGLGRPATELGFLAATMGTGTRGAAAVKGVAQKALAKLPGFIKKPVAGLLGTGTRSTYSGAAGLAGGEAYDVGARAAGMEDVRTPEERQAAQTGAFTSYAIGEALAPPMGKAATAASRKAGKMREGVRPTRPSYSAIEEATGAQLDPRTVATATGLPAVKAAEGFVQKMPFAPARIKQAGREAAKDIGGAIRQRFGISSLGDDIPSAGYGGRNIKTGIAGRGGAEQMASHRVDTAYTKFREAYNTNSPINPGELSKVADDFLKSGSTSDRRIGKIIERELKRYETELKRWPTYDEMMTFKDDFAARIKGDPVLKTLPEKRFKRITKAVFDDIERTMNPKQIELYQGARKVAESRFVAYKNFKKGLMDTPSDEKAFFKFEKSVREGDASTVGAVLAEMPKAERNAVTGTIFSRLGREKGIGEWSFKQWAKDMKGLSDDTMDALLPNWRSQKDLKVLRSEIEKIAELVPEPKVNPWFQASMLGIPSAGVLGAALKTMDPMAVVGALASAGVTMTTLVGLSRGAGNILTKPGFVRWMRDFTSSAPKRGGLEAILKHGTEWTTRLAAISQGWDPEDRAAIGAYIDSLNSLIADASEERGVEAAARSGLTQPVGLLAPGGAPGAGLLG